MIRPVIVVVLSTYNGARYLPQQLESLSTQSCRPDRLVVRDDGSTDESAAIVRSWAAKEGVELHLFAGPREGPARSFLIALQAAGNADIFLFCDQDDVWLPDKIERAANGVPWGEGAAPALYASRLEVVDEGLHFLGHSAIPRRISFGSAVCESLLTGCTMAFNAPFRALLVRHLPQHMAMHDWWCYLLVTGGRDAKLHFDPRPSILYRQHGKNVVGARKERFVKRVRRFLGSNPRVRSKQLEEFVSIFSSELTPFASELTSRLLQSGHNFEARWRTAAFASIGRQSRFSTAATRLSLFLNRF